MLDLIADVRSLDKYRTQRRTTLGCERGGNAGALQ